MTQTTSNLSLIMLTSNQNKIREINEILTVDQQMKFEVFSFTYRRDLRKTLESLLSFQKLDVKSQSK